MYHADAILASIASFGTTASLASTYVPDPSEPASMLPYLISVAGPALVLVANRLLSAQAARKRARATFEESEAKRLEADTDPSNDARASDLRRAAAEDRAEAAALEALKPESKE